MTMKNNDDETALHIAIEENNEDISLLFISYLLKNNIKLEKVTNISGLTPLQLAILLYRLQQTLHTEYMMM